MQVNLSNLVDLALGTPHQLACENFNILHTLLHILLKKVNLSDAQVELTGELAAKAEDLMKLLPLEPSICFKEFVIKADGTKVRKRNSREVTIKRSLTQVTKKWPKCCLTTSSAHSAVHPNIVNPSQFDIDASLSNLTAKFVPLFDDLGDRIEALEVTIHKFSDQFEAQNRAALDDFVKMKESFEASRSSRTPLSAISNDEFDNGLVAEVKWLKEQMLELSNSLKLHSQCLRRLKCNEFKNLKDEVEEIGERLQGFNCQLLEKQSATKDRQQATIDRRDSGRMQKEIDCLKGEFRTLTTQVQLMDLKRVDLAQKTVGDQMCSLKLDFTSHMHRQMWSQTSSSYDNLEDVINQQNLQPSEDECKRSQSIKKSGCPPVSYPRFSTDQLNTSPPCPVGDRLSQESIAAQASNPFIFQRQDSSFDKSQNRGMNFAECFDNIQNQITSQRSCLQHLIQEMAKKLNRSEFEMYDHQLSETSDLVTKLNRAHQSAAAGVSIPLTRNLNCISCQSPAHMKRSERSTVPRAPALKFGRYPRTPSRRSMRSQCHNISKGNWSCYNRFIGHRAAGGSHTKISAALKVREMRFKRMKTPIKIVSSVFVYKNRFRRGCANC